MFNRTITTTTETTDTSTHPQRVFVRLNPSLPLIQQNQQDGERPINVIEGFNQERQQVWLNLQNQLNLHNQLNQQNRQEDTNQNNDDVMDIQQTGSIIVQSPNQNEENEIHQTVHPIQPNSITTSQNNNTFRMFTYPSTPEVNLIHVEENQEVNLMPIENQIAHPVVPQAVVPQESFEVIDLMIVTEPATTYNLPTPPTIDVSFRIFSHPPMPRGDFIRFQSFQENEIPKRNNNPNIF